MDTDRLQLSVDDLNDANIQQIVTRVQPRIHENILHLVSKRFHRLMHRSVDLNIHVTRHMSADLRQSYVTELIDKLSLVRKIHMLQVFSEWGTIEESARVLRRFIVPVADTSQEAVGEAFVVVLKTLRLELHEVSRLPANIWDLTTLTTLHIDKCMRIRKISSRATSLPNLTYLHLDDCTRLGKMRRAPLNLHTLRITACPIFVRVPRNLHRLLMLTTLQFHELAVRILPDMQTLSKLKSLTVSTCNQLKTIGVLPSSLATLVITVCRSLLTVPQSIQSLFELETLELEDIPGSGPFLDISFFDKLTRLSIKDCQRIAVPGLLPASLVHFEFSDKLSAYTRRVVDAWPSNMDLLVNLKTLNIDMQYTQVPDLSHMPELTNLVLWSGNGSMSVRLPAWLETLHILSRTPDSTSVANGFPVNLGLLTRLKEFVMVALRVRDCDWLQLQRCADRSLARDGIGFRRLSVVNCQMPRPPEWIAEHGGLEALDLSCNHFRELPAAYANLKNLRSLSIGNNIQMQQYDTMLDSEQTILFPTFIYALPRLRELNVSAFFEGRPYQDTGADFVPVQYMQFERLTHLTSLDISGNRFRVMPDGMSLLTSLVYLNFSDNGCQRIDMDFSGMTRLEHLIIQNCLHTLEAGRLDSIILSDTIADLRSLKHLDLSDSDLWALPRNMDRLQNLEYLDISDCMLHTLPACISRLAKLKTWNASSNALSEVAEDIGNMRSLTHLDISDNSIQSIPLSICDLAHLRYLSISLERVASTPPEFFEFIASSLIQTDLLW